MRWTTALVGLAFLASAGLGIGQETTGEIIGRITAVDGQVLPGVSLTADNPETGFRRSAIANENGAYRLVALPPARYQLTAALPGFQTSERTVKVEVGRTVTADLPLAVSAFEDSIVVTSDVPLLDVTTAVAGINVDAQELGSQIPLAREATQVVLLAPSTVLGDQAFQTDNTPGQALTSMAGASVAENLYLVNGLDITNFRNGLGSSLVPFEFVDEIQVKSGGYEAEYGRSTGGVVSILTRSGTNTLRGGVSLYAEPAGMQAHEPDTYQYAHQLESRRSLEANASLGGPVVRDRLFFFAFVRYLDVDSDHLRDGRREEWSLAAPYWGGKLDWNITPSHRLEGTYLDDGVTKDIAAWPFDLASHTTGDALGTGTEQRGGASYIAKYVGILGQHLMVAGQYGVNTFDRTNSSAQDDCPYAADYRTGRPIPVGCWVNWERGAGSTDERRAYRLDVDVFAGDHGLRSGIDYQHNTSTDDWEYSGGVRYIYALNGPRFPQLPPTTQLVQVSHRSSGGSFDTFSRAAYLQDGWALHPNLTLNLGLRYEEFDNRNGLGETFIEVTGQWGPRAGVVWDPSGTGRQKVFASYGRYHLPIASNTNVRTAGGEYVDQVGYVYDGSPLNPDGSPPGYTDCGFTTSGGCPNQGSVGDLLLHLVPLDGVVPDPRAMVSDHLSPMSQDELILGYERMVGDLWSVGGRFVARSFNQVIEDFSLDQGLAVVYPGVFEPGVSVWRIGNPGSDFTGWVDVDGDGVLDRVTLTAEQLGFPEAVRDYYAVELTARRRFAGNWMVQAAYTWSHLYGNYEGWVNSDIGQDDAGLTETFDIPALMDGASGDLPQDRRHNLKLFGAYTWGSGLQVGSNLWFVTGRPVNSLSVHPTDETAQSYGAVSFYLPGDGPGTPLAPRGSQGRTDDLWALDLMLSYTLGLGSVDLDLRLDVFNTFDNRGVAEVEERSEDVTGIPYAYWKQPTAYQAPRTVRFGVAVSF